ncbi:hypothetical protein NE237_014441 [Protea cynaroides]|uniref:Uncharacterized protein n=1 Tax=Protea cynaroides TaxID=273540 RepID=A0A9Q0QQ43_9MAGN|nr:hypothetical protein NE237_014441 [Protea cynaroides]
MIGACEKHKLVYKLNRDTAARRTISLLLEAHKSHTTVYSICSAGCGFDNPTFAAIELNYSEVDQDSTGFAANKAQKHQSVLPFGRPTSTNMSPDQLSSVGAEVVISGKSSQSCQGLRVVLRWSYWANYLRLFVVFEWCQGGHLGQQISDFLWSSFGA